MRKYIGWIGLIILFLTFDQTLKIWVKTNMILGEQIPILGNWFYLYFAENSGAAFGFSINQSWFKPTLTILRIFIILFIVIFFVRLKNNNAVPSGVSFCFSLIMAGAVGNVVDSVFYGTIFTNSYLNIATFTSTQGYAPLLYGKVVDMLYFPIIKTTLPTWLPVWGGNYFEFFRPIFNLSDSYITISIFLVLIFYRKWFKSLPVTKKKKPVDKKIEKYILNHTQEEDTLLNTLARETHLSMINPRMLSGHYIGFFLSMLVRMIKPKKILEIGTFTGYATICIARNLSNGDVIHTIDKNEELRSFTKKYFKASKQEDKIIFYQGNALEIIPQIDENFDLVSIDANKSEYVAYYKTVFPKLKKGGFIIADNALWDGKVVKKLKKNDKETAGIVSFNDYVQNDTRVENMILPIRDGLMLIWKK